MEKHRKKIKEKKKQERSFRISDDILWGIHPVFEILQQQPERISELIMHRDSRGGKREDIIARARNEGIKLQFVDRIQLAGEDAAQIRHQGVVAKITSTPLVDFEVMLEKFRQLAADGQKPHFLALDSLQDPHNVGAIIRSACVSGIDGVIMTRERSAPLGGTAAKASAGAMAHIDICQVTNLVNSLKALKKAGAWVFGAIKDDDAQPVFTADFTSPACLVVGSEGKGVRQLVKKECDVLVSIPMKGQLDSLNSSVAAGVIVFEMMRQKDLAKLNG